jgi:hypothetical protein
MALERQVESVGPAGGVWSNARDMARYGLTEMARGVSPAGKRVVSEENVLERHKMRARIGDVDGYGLGIGTGTFRDLPYLMHSGGTAGFGSLLWLLPEQGIGVVSLTNSATGHGWNELVVRKVVELLFEGARELAAARLEFQVRTSREVEARAREHLPRTSDALSALVARLAGKYSSAELGDAELRAEDGGGVFDVGEWKSAVARVEDNAGGIGLTLLDAPVAGLGLAVGGSEERPTLSVRDAQVEYVFERVAG